MIRATLATYAPATWGGMAQAENLAESRATMYPGAVVDWVPRGDMGLGGDYWAVVHPDAEGLAVTHYQDTILPAGTTLERRDSIVPGDKVWSTHSSIRTVAKAVTLGAHKDRPGTTYLTLEGVVSGPEAYSGNLLIPVISRAAEAPRLRLSADEVLLLTIEARRRAERGPLTIDFGGGRDPILHVHPDSEWAREFIIARRRTYGDVTVTAAVEG